RKAFPLFQRIRGCQILSCRMKISLHSKSQLFISTNHGDGNDVSVTDEEGCVEHIFRRVDLRLADLEKDIALLDTGINGWCTIHDLGHLCPRSFNGERRFGHIDADPSMAWLAKA